jgi:hypothetical protein
MSLSEHLCICDIASRLIFYRSLRPLIVALIPGQQRSLDKLKTTRLRLSNEVAAVINEFGPKLYDDFDEARLLFGYNLC